MPETPNPDPVLLRICESSTRLMAGLVPRKTLQELQKMVRGATGDYPWDAVVDRVLRDAVSPQTLTTQALRSQRDWVVRGGRERPGKGVAYRAKSGLARLLARMIFLAILIPAVVALLVLVKQRWPEIDIYRINQWLAQVWPSAFSR